MATADSVKAKLQGLIDAANAVTGTADTDMTAAVNNLILGFGGGGIDIKSMTVTPAEVVSTVTLDDLGYGTRQVDEDSNVGPRNMAEYKNVDELLSTFMVDGELFSEAVLPTIEQLHTVYYA